MNDDRNSGKPATAAPARAEFFLASDDACSVGCGPSGKTAELRVAPRAAAGGCCA